MMMMTMIWQGLFSLLTLHNLMEAASVSGQTWSRQVFFPRVFSMKATAAGAAAAADGVRRG